MKKQHIISGAIILIIAAAVGFKWYSYKHPGAFAAPVTKVSTLPATDDGKTSISVNTNTGEVAVEEGSSTIVTTRPINGKLKGVVEVGASGFNSFVVDIDKDKNWELVSKEFGKSNAYEGFATVSDVERGLKDYIAHIFDKGVSGRNVHFVMSSGALKNPKTVLIAAAIEKSGYVVNRVTADAEGKYALKAALPKNYRDNSFVVDMGSGNTKITWYDKGGAISIECPGAKYYQDGDNGQTKKTDAEVYNLVKDAVSRIPAANRERCFIIGGVPHDLADVKDKGNASKSRFTLLDAPDEYSADDNVKLRSGLNIYRAIAETSGTKQFYFDWDANFTIGFLMTLN